MAPKYKLTYFNIGGVAEPIRYLFAYAKQEFEDNRIKREQWPELKLKTPFGKVPILEVDGKQLNQSGTIARYLAKKFNLVSKDEWEAVQAEALVDTFGDFKTVLMKRFHETDESKIADNKKDEAFYLEKFDKIVSGNPSGYLVGSQLTWADIVVASNLSEVRNRSPDALKPYPGLTKLVDTVNNIPSIKSYLEKRPKPDAFPAAPPKK